MITSIWGAAPRRATATWRSNHPAEPTSLPAAVAAVTLPGDRRDDLLAESAGAIAASFGAVVIYEDSDKRGRQPGEMQQLISAALREARPGIICQFADSPEQALRVAIALAAGAPTLFLYEKLAAAQAALAVIGAAPWPDAATPLSPAGHRAGPWPAAERHSDSELDPADITLPDITLPDFSGSAGSLAPEATRAFGDASADYEPRSEDTDTPSPLAVE